MRTALAAVLLLCLSLAGRPALAAPPATSPASLSAATATAPSSAPVPVPQPSAQAMRYYRTGNVLWLIATLWSLAVPALLLRYLTGVWTDDKAKKPATSTIQSAARPVPGGVQIIFLDLPLAWYAGFVREHAYGLSEQTAAKWWSDELKGLALGCVFTALILWFPYLLLRKSPRRWWLYTGLASVPLLVLLLFVTPLWIEPLFNHFGPMKDKALEADILSLAGRAGIAGSRVYEVDKSVDTKTVNAYVTGFGGSKRIVLWDTTLAKLDRPEVLLVMGHEMGHYVLGHVPVLIAVGSLLVLCGLWVVHRTAHGLIARFAGRFGFRELADVASVPLMSLLFSLVALLLTPAILGVTRHTEHEADRFGLEITSDNHHCATAFVKLQQENLDNPRPGWLYKLWRSSHPPLGERIDFCNDYRPWERGEPLEYGDLIRPPAPRS